MPTHSPTWTQSVGTISEVHTTSLSTIEIRNLPGYLAGKGCIAQRTFFLWRQKRKFKKKVGIEMPFILRLNRVIELLEMVDMPVNQAR